MTRQGEANQRAAYAELVAASLIEPVALGTADERIWADCDLASLAENRLGVSFDPRSLDERLRKDLQTRATTEPMLGITLPPEAALPVNPMVPAIP